MLAPATPAQLEFTRKLIDALPLPVFFKARDGRYLGVNRAWEALFGLKREQFIGRTVQDLYASAPEIARRHMALDEQLWRKPGMQSYEFSLTAPGGRVRHFLDFKATFEDERGAVAGLIGTLIEITERKQNEQRQRIEHMVARLLADSSTLAEAIGGIIQGLCEELGWACGARWSLEESGQTLRCVESWGAGDPAISAFLDESRSRSYAPGKSGLVRRVLGTGEPVWIEDVASQRDFLRAKSAAAAGLRSAFALPVRLGERVLGAIEFYSRETRAPDPWLMQIAETIGQQIGQLMARRQAEAALRESEARFRSLTDLSSDWYWEQDAQFRFTRFEGRHVKLDATAFDRYLGKTPWETGLEIEGDWKAFEELHRAHRPFRDAVLSRALADGARRWISVSGEPMFTADGEFRGYRGVGKDITRQKAAEAALREAHAQLAAQAKELARSNEDLQQFAYVASHDLQEPLRMVSSYTQLILRRYGDRFDKDAREFMAFVVDGATRMKQLIEDLLAYSRVGTRGRDFEWIDAGAALAKALANLRAAIESSQARLTADPLPRVWADGAQLAQVLQNLIGNAIKFRSAEPPQIRICAREADAEWIFSVSDNGIGIEPQYFERIFVMFQRLHSKADYPGTGIGLAICKKIVDRHGGRIWVESQPGAGSTFHFSLPRPVGGSQ